MVKSQEIDIFIETILSIPIDYILSWTSNFAQDFSFLPMNSQGGFKCNFVKIHSFK